ncbi:H-NS histone family protein [Isoalcanivorax beigongshangi]|uniref:H-NS family nucleoid-associated regulatory protein n=1 Tax=Isoalcanivorax beigongshangi TaxID=3238810 RepID=A0ABV4ADB3_9GAMM
MNINLAPLSVEELEQVITDARTLIEKKKTEHIRNARAEVEAIARKAGITIEELLGLKAGAQATTKTGRRPAPVKFRHPEDPSLTWTGRGKRPNWLAAELANGKALEDFAI